MRWIFIDGPIEIQIPFHYKDVHIRKPPFQGLKGDQVDYKYLFSLRLCPKTNNYM